MSLATPSGRMIGRDTQADDVIHTLGEAFETYTILHPESGQWDIFLEGADLPPEGEQVLVNAATAPNNPPIALCRDVILEQDECYADISVDNGSYDLDQWDSLIVTQSPAGPYPIGENVVTLTVTDINGACDTCYAIIEVTEREAPIIENLVVSPDILWPPNHKMVPVSIAAEVQDNCDPAPTCQIILVDSNEPIDGLGDSNTAPDWEITGALTVDLRAERSGSGGGRVYTIIVECTDASGNTSTDSVEVTVPHDQGKKKGKCKGKKKA
ncbi:MAG TPA: hypothetical protein EYP19_07140 [Desulfobacterales bacterium]|nr:hypothetical protein [Desulfobacterales bacterium]